MIFKELKQRLDDWREYKQNHKLDFMLKDLVMDCPQLHSKFYFLMYSREQREQHQKEELQQLKDMLEQYEKEVKQNADVR